MTTISPPRPRRAPIADDHDFGRYTDTGCSVAPSCLVCPLPACALDAGRHAARNAEIVQLTRAGWSKRRLAAHYGLSVRQVGRIRRAAGVRSDRRGGRPQGPARARRSASIAPAVVAALAAAEQRRRQVAEGVA
jgi:hypothetical protein